MSEKLTALDSFIKQYEEIEKLYKTKKKNIEVIKEIKDRAIL